MSELPLEKWKMTEKKESSCFEIKILSVPSTTEHRNLDREVL